MTLRSLAPCLVLVLAACSSTPERTADKFVDLYFVQMDQARARPLTTGLATRKLDEELHLVESVRRDYEPDDHKQPSVFFERVGVMLRNEHASATYKVHVKYEGQTTNKHVMISLEQTADGWRVGNYLISDDPSPGPRNGP